MGSKSPENKDETLVSQDQPSCSKSANVNEEDLGSSTSLLNKEDDETTVEMIRKYMAEKLGFSESKKGEETKKKVLDEVSVDGVIKYIKSGQCNNIIIMAGAGISTSAGIPDFRSPKSGLYQNLAKYNLPHPQGKQVVMPADVMLVDRMEKTFRVNERGRTEEAIFEIDFFKENPKPFYALAKELFPGTYKPTAAHYFIRLLHEKGLLLRHYTQNVDGLEKLAGIPAEKIVEAHGTFYTSHCMTCKKEFSLDWMRDVIFADKIPKCIDCKGLVKPDIVFFGENLPGQFFTFTKKDFPKADLLIIMGSSLVVQPFASLVDRVNSNCPRLLINKEKAGQKDKLLSLFGMGGGLDLDSDKNYRDVALLGDCDELCRQLVDRLGWKEEYEELIHSFT